MLHIKICIATTHLDAGITVITNIVIKVNITITADIDIFVVTAINAAITILCLKTGLVLKPIAAINVMNASIASNHVWLSMRMKFLPIPTKCLIHS